MTVLPDHQIRHCSTQDEVRNRLPLIEPFDERHLQPSSYDVLLAPKVRVPVASYSVLDLRKPAEDDTEIIDISNGFILAQGHFILGATVEKVNISDHMVGRIEGKSSRARQGLQIHSAGYLDPGFRGNVTLEIVNFSPRPMMVWPMILIAQLSFEWLDTPCEQPYSSERNHYQDSEGVVGSRYGQ